MESDNGTKDMKAVCQTAEDIKSALPRRARFDGKRKAVDELVGEIARLNGELSATSYQLKCQKALVGKGVEDKVALLDAIAKMYAAVGYTVRKDCPYHETITLPSIEMNRLHGEGAWNALRSYIDKAMEPENAKKG